MLEPNGWYVDPFGRHEARYVSGGKATSLVRDRGEESQDPPPSQSVPVTDLRPAESHDYDGETPERVFRGQNFESRWGGSAGYGRRDPLPDENWVSRLILPMYLGVNPSRFQEHGYLSRFTALITKRWIFLVLGLVAAALLALPSQAAAPHRFTPTAAQRDVLTRGGAGLAPACPGGSSTGSPLRLDISDADRDFTVYRHGVVEVTDTDGEGQPELSSHAPLCRIDAMNDGDDTGDGSVVDYDATRPGRATFYFITPDARVSVVDVTVTAASPPSGLARLITFVLVLILVVCVAIIVVAEVSLRRRSRRYRIGTAAGGGRA